MSHFGLFCPPAPGHINPFAVLGRALRSRGHRVTMFQLPELKDMVERHALEFRPLGRDSDAAGELSVAVRQLGAMTGLDGVTFTIRCAARLAQVVLDSAPREMQRAGLDLALVDQNEPAAAAACEHIGLPFISVAASLPINREACIPPPFVDWTWSTSRAGQLRNRVGYAISDLLLTPLSDVLNKARKKWSLPALGGPDDSFSRLAQISTMPASLDFPRSGLPQNFHYLGPFIEDAGPEVDFPWEKLDGRPLVYASFGTLQNRRADYFSTVAAACVGLNIQLVMSTGGGEVDCDDLPGDPIVVPYIAQRKLLSRAVLAITHAGLNTVLDALCCGVPMVAVPVTNDQPAIAARIERTGAGRVVPIQRLSAERLRTEVETVLDSQSYRQRAAALRDEIRASGGLGRAADLVEHTLAAVRNGHNRERQKAVPA